jgi:hypothetical protein
VPRLAESTGAARQRVLAEHAGRLGGLVAALTDAPVAA